VFFALNYKTPLSWTSLSKPILYPLIYVMGVLLQKIQRSRDISNISESIKSSKSRDLALEVSEREDF